MYLYLFEALSLKDQVLLRENSDRLLTQIPQHRRDCVLKTWRD